MIKLLIISSLRSKELGEFLTQRGTFDVEGCYTSLSADAANIQNQIIKVDKTLYLYQLDEDGNSNVNIRSDMQVLQNLLKNNTFFNPGEIIFMTQNTLQCAQAEKYFTTVMTACNYDNYSIKRIEGQLSFSEIYSGLMGISINENFKNTYKPLYRVERNSDSSTAYEQQDDFYLSLEPFNFDQLKSYNDRKTLAAKTSSTIPFKDTPVDTERFQNPDFTQLKIDDGILRNNINLLTGKSKSGLTTWTIAFAASAASEGKSVLILDFTSNSDVKPMMENSGIKINIVTIKEMLRKTKEGSTGISVCSIRNDREERIKLNFLQRYFSIASGQYDVVLLPVEPKYFEQVHTLLREQINKVLFTVVPRRTDVVELQQYIKCIEGEDVMVLMNECVNLTHDSYISQQEVKKLLVFFNPRVVSSCTFKDFNLKGTLYNKILMA